MKIAPVAEVKAQFSAYLKAAEEGPVVVTRHGKAVAVLLSAEDDDELERLILGYTPSSRGFWKRLGSRFKRQVAYPMTNSGRT
jgi:prevent-host-death family protein